jgi:hypothetical protein
MEDRTSTKRAEPLGPIESRPTAIAIPLSDQQRWFFAAALLLLTLAYLLASGKEFAASLLASHSDLTQLQRAVRISPGDADYRHRLGAFLAFDVGDPQASLASYRSAVALNPYNAGYWLDLAAACQVTADLDCQRNALDRAVAAEPTAPGVAWQAANSFLVDGQIDRALREFRVVIENDNTLAAPALEAAWRVRPDPDALLRDVVPAKPDSLIAFLTLLMTKQQTDAAIKTWERLCQLRMKFDNSRLYEYVTYLVKVHRPDAAITAWEQAAPSLGLSGYLPGDDNLIVNGDFSLDILNGGLDWTYVNRTGVHPVLDSSDFREGHRSLSIAYEGAGISDSGIQQLIPVHGGTTYDFSAYYKSGDFEGVGGPQIVLHDAYTDAALYTSDPLTEADFWKNVSASVKTPASTTLLRLAIERVPAGSPIRGKLWLDDLQLSPHTSTNARNRP